jgi:hypothetical protein
MNGARFSRPVFLWAYPKDESGVAGVINSGVINQCLPKKWCISPEFEADSEFKPEEYW